MTTGIRWLIVAIRSAVNGMGAMLFVLALMLDGLLEVGSIRWRRWLAHARGEDIVAPEPPDGAIAVPAAPTQTVVELLQPSPEGGPQLYATTGRAPIRAEHRDAQREMHALAERMAGRKLSWKSARKLLKAHQRAGGFA